MFHRPRLSYDNAVTTSKHDQLVETVTASSFEATVLQASGPIVAEFMSYGCAHCRTIEPVVLEVAKALEQKERIVRVNVGIDQDLASSYSVAGTPTFVMFLNGREVGRAEGPHPSFASVMSAVTQPFQA
jgi:thioredoxin 1